MAERIHLGVTEARALGEAAMRGAGYDAEEAHILIDHVLDAALCGYEYSGLPKLLNIVDHADFKRPRRPITVLRETGRQRCSMAATTPAWWRRTARRR